MLGGLKYTPSAAAEPEPARKERSRRGETRKASRVGGGGANGAAVSGGDGGAGGVRGEENGGGGGGEGGGGRSWWEEALDEAEDGRGDQVKRVEKEGEGDQGDEYMRLVPPEDGWVEVKGGEESGECIGRGSGVGQVAQERGNEGGAGAGTDVEMTEIDKEREQLLAGGYVPER
jgi:hypothetical protein